jgi:hypothetical protein
MNDKPKSRTFQALQKRREAYVDRATKMPAIFAPMLERKADELLTLPKTPDVGAGGEVVREQAPDQPYTRGFIRDTLLQGADAIAEDASIRRADLLSQASFDCVALGVDLAESIEAANAAEKMLAHQMAAAHEASMRLLNESLTHAQSSTAHTHPTLRTAASVEACRLGNTAARLMRAYQEGLLTLQRLRTGGRQTVTVQHVNVEAGGRAVVGAVQAGGPNYSGAARK